MGIDVFGGLRIKRARGGKSAKVSVEFKAPSLVFEPHEKHIAKTLALAMAKKFREYMLDGRWLDGRPLPAVSAATVKRREYRLLQVERGGAPLVSSRNVIRRDTRQRKRLDRRYATKKIGTTYPTRELSGKGVLGLESGTMANFSVAPGAQGFSLFVPDIRGKIDKRGVSPWLVVVRKMGGIGRMDGLLSTPSLLLARASAWWSCWLLDGARMLDSKDFRRGIRSLKRIGSELLETAENIKGIAAEAEQLAESDSDGT